MKIEIPREMPSIKELIRNAMELSTFHAIPNIARTKRTSIQVMWILILIVSSVCCSFLVIKTIIQYFSFEVVNKSNVAYENPTKFPTVTVCNINPYVTDAALEYLGEFFRQNNVSESQYDAALFKANSKFLERFYSMKATQFMAIGHSMNPNVTQSQQKSFGLPLDKFVIMCVYRSAECNASEFSWFFDPIYGNCWKFNSGQDSMRKPIGIKATSQPGFSEGLLMFLYTGVPNSWLTFSYKTGARVFINNNTVEPGPYDGIEVATGFQTNFQVDREFIYKLPQPYNDCYNNLDREDAFDSDLYHEILRANKTYRQTDCFRLCLQKEMINTCKCYNALDAPLYGSEPCSNGVQLLCVSKVYEDFYSKDLSAKCGYLCPLECNSVLYTFTSSFSDFPTNSFVTFMNGSQVIRDIFPGQEITQKLIRENFVLLNIYYGQTKYLKVEEVESMNIVDLISNIGGTLGVFLGVSFLSLIEVIELAAEILLSRIESHKTTLKSKLARIQPVTPEPANMEAQIPTL